MNLQVQNHLIVLPESAPIGDNLKSSSSFGRLRSFFVILATYNMVCSRKPVVEFDGLNSIFPLVCLFHPICSTKLWFLSIVDAKYRLNARSKLYSANFSTANFCLTTHYSVNSIGFDQKSTKIIAFYMPIEHPHRIKSDAANSKRNFSCTSTKKTRRNKRASRLVGFRCNIQ